MRKGRKRICIALITLIMVSIGAGFLCDKFVRALSLRTELDKCLRSKNYKKAEVIYKSMDKDVFYRSSLKIKNRENSIINKNLNDIKKDYISENITYKNAEDTISQIKKFDFIDKKYINKIEAYIKNSNNDEKVISTAQNLYEDREYLTALNDLNKSKGSTQKIQDRKNELSKKIKNSLTNYTDEKIEEYLSKLDDKSALDILNKNSKYLDDKYVLNKKDEIKGFSKSVVLEKSKITNISSTTNYLIIVDLKHQLTEIYIRKEYGWNLKKLFQSSTGISGYDTPKGTFSIKDKGNWFYSQKYNEGAKYWVRFNNSYLFHSLPMNKNQKIKDYTLGQAASHGCVRLKVSEAKWIFDNIPRYTKVIVE